MRILLSRQAAAAVGIVTPHSAGHSDGNEARVAEMFLENLARFVRGQPLLRIVVPGP